MVWMDVVKMVSLKDTLQPTTSREATEMTSASQERQHGVNYSETCNQNPMEKGTV